MEWIEVTGRTVEDAKELALDRLGVVEAELEFEVIDEPRGGLFGRIGRTEARIRARVKPLSREKPGDRRRRRTRQTKARREPAAVATATAERTRDDDAARSANGEDGPPARTGASRSRRRRRRTGSGGGSAASNGETGVE